MNEEVSQKMMDVYMTYCVEILDRLLVKREHQNRPQMMDVLGMVKTCHVCLTILRFPNRTTTPSDVLATTSNDDGEVWTCFPMLRESAAMSLFDYKIPAGVGCTRYVSFFFLSLSLSVSNAAPNEHITNTQPTHNEHTDSVPTPCTAFDVQDKDKRTSHVHAPV